MTKKKSSERTLSNIFDFKVSNSRAALFAKMPKILQDPTHCLWWDYRDLPFDKDTFDAVTSRAMFQKTAYRYESARHPLPGSFADEMINRMFL